MLRVTDFQPLDRPYARHPETRALARDYVRRMQRDEADGDLLIEALGLVDTPPPPPAEKPKAKHERRPCPGCGKLMLSYRKKCQRVGCGRESQRKAR